MSLLLATTVFSPHIEKPKREIFKNFLNEFLLLLKANLGNFIIYSKYVFNLMLNLNDLFFKKRFILKPFFSTKVMYVHFRMFKI